MTKPRQREGSAVGRAQACRVMQAPGVMVQPLTAPQVRQPRTVIIARGSPSTCWHGRLTEKPPTGKVTRQIEGINRDFSLPDCRFAWTGTLHSHENRYRRLIERSLHRSTHPRLAWKWQLD